MIVYRAQDFINEGPVRSHPYIDSESNESFKYYNFRKNPELIRTSLEDFLPYGENVEPFYRLLEWINTSDDSVLESNDSGLRPLKPTVSVNTSNKAYELHGRLMIFYRHLEFNTIHESTEWLLGATEHYLKQVDPLFTTDRVIGLNFDGAAFEALNHAFGRELVIQFWAFGDTDDETFQNLNLVFSNLQEAFKRVSKEVKESIVEQNK